MPDDAAIGVLALQGDFARHRAALERRSLPVREVRTPEELRNLSGFVLPGGESTTMVRLLEREGLWDPLRTALRVLLDDGRPVLATCAGVVLAAARVSRPEQPSLGLLDADVERNAYGRQRASGRFPLSGDAVAGRPQGVFIRAPRVARVGDTVEVLARRGPDPVFLRQGSLLATTFHPELEEDHPAYALFRALWGRAAVARP